MVVNERFYYFKNITSINLKYKHCVLIIDFTWWVDYEVIIHEWLNINVGTDKFQLDGVILQFKEEESVTLFLLRWN